MCTLILFLVEDNENWVTIKKDEQSGECVDDDSPNAEKDQSLKSVKKSASDTKLNSQKSKLKKDGCRMSWGFRMKHIK